jgi:hypothetical protein
MVAPGPRYGKSSWVRFQATLAKGGSEFGVGLEIRMESLGPETLASGSAVDVLRRRRYGVIEIVDGRLRRVVLRRLPRLVTVPEILLLGQWTHRASRGDRLWLYYNQPWRFPNFLVLKYVVSAAQTSMGSLCRALAVLDEIARLKQSDALLCEVENSRISTRLLSRWGWASHCPTSWRRHYIKRFYGNYPARPWWLDSGSHQRHGEPNDRQQHDDHGQADEQEHWEEPAESEDVLHLIPDRVPGGHCG